MTSLAHKAVPFELDEKATDTKQRIIAGYASVFGNVDHDREIVMPGAFKSTLVERGDRVKVLWQHDDLRPIGRPIEMREDSHGLYTKSQLADTALVRDEIMPLVSEKVVDQFSIGYVPEHTTYDTQKRATRLDTVHLFEYSLVTFPANEQASVTSVKQRAERALGLERADEKDLTADDAKYAMAVLMGARGAGAFSDLPAYQRRALYDEIATKYAALELTPPEYVDAPCYGDVKFEHDERIVYAARSLRKRIADVTSAARGYSRLGGTIPAAGVAEARDALAAIEALGFDGADARLDAIARRKRVEARLGVTLA